ncbi:hypothetical protein BCR34DRAFT_346558 [Clohesyomyces aquaticus]|uniref:Uncharacterized protein n=1 Tax=Clohesyomyces aquaticus TaxID=1231657 RepID=A0A1Y1ZKI9_9PLEO|nr:hypothetical protein BCR34DRAFT_346558 [Clohesyomyces aquaticus]
MSAAAKNIVVSAEPIVVAHKLITADTNKYILIKQAIVVGLPGAGTDAIVAALKKLELKVYDTDEFVKQRERDAPLWLEAKKAKKAGIPYGRNEYDKLTGRYNAVVGIPSVFFAKDLVDAYLDTKVILVPGNVSITTKMTNSVIWYTGSAVSPLKVFSFLDPIFFGKLSALLKVCVTPYFGKQIAAAEAHKSHAAHGDAIRKAVPAKRLLEINEFTSWDLLCAFLGKAIPADPIPVMKDDLTTPYFGPAKKVVESYCSAVGVDAYYCVVVLGVAIAKYVIYNLCRIIGVIAIDLLVLTAAVVYFLCASEAAKRLPAAPKAEVAAEKPVAEKKEAAVPPHVAAKIQKSSAIAKKETAAPTPPHRRQKNWAGQGGRKATHGRSQSGPVERPPRPIRGTVAGWANWSVDIAKDYREKYVEAKSAAEMSKGVQLDMTEKFVARK